MKNTNSIERMIKLESREMAKGLLGFIVLLLCLAGAILLAWLIGPFGPIIHANWLKWIITAVDFLLICFVMLAMIALAINMDWEWYLYKLPGLQRVEDWLTEQCRKYQKYLKGIQERRQARQKPTN